MLFLSIWSYMLLATHNALYKLRNTIQYFASCNCHNWMYKVAQILTSIVTELEACRNKFIERVLYKFSE